MKQEGAPCAGREVRALFQDPEGLAALGACFSQQVPSAFEAGVSP
jgi:hypothetical protein